MTKNSENKSMPIMPSQMVLPTVDMEYLFRFEGTLAGLEKSLHNDDDPEEIAMQTIEVARDFYDADWCGLISGDLDAGIFYPYWWVNRAEGRMAQTKFDEFEFLQDYDTWTHALLHGENVVLNGLEQRKAGVTGSEFRHYQKMDVQSVIGIPLFYHKPCGFMIVKNPRLYTDQPTMLAILGYVVLNCWKEQQNLEALKLQMKQPCAELASEKDVYIRLFGEPEIHTLKGQLSAQTLNSPKGWRLISYLVLHKRPMPIRTIAEALSNDSESEYAQNALRVVMSRMKPKLESILDPKNSLVVNSGYGYRINDFYNLITDLQEFERYIANAKAQPDISPRIEEYKKAVKLYRGPVYREASHVASVEGSVNGAGVIAYPDFMDQVADQIGGDFFVLPSSVHEVLVLPDDGNMDRHDLENMVREVNSTEVDPKDQLSDNVYHYDSQDKIFELAEKYENRVAERPAQEYGSQTQDQPAEVGDTMNVLLVEPNRYPKEIQIGDDLESLQQAVGGNIEVAYPFEENVGIIMNEEGKLEGQPLNRALRDDEGQITDVVAGSFLVVGLTEDSFTSLTPDQMEKFEETFHQPEAFVKMGKGIMAVPIPDNVVKEMEKEHEKPAKDRPKPSRSEDVLS